VLPQVRDRLTAAAALAEAVGVDVPRPFAADVERRDVDLGGVAADLYDPGSAAPGLLLVPGAAPAGRDDERVVRLATALARSRVAVLVPELALYDHRFAAADLQTLVHGVQALRLRSPGRPVAMLGISFGGSLALVAAADPRVSRDVGTVATFGAYADLGGLVQAAATGVSVVGRDRYTWTPPPQARQGLRALALELTPAAEREALRSALESGTGVERLGPAARTAYDLVTVSDPDAVPGLVAALPPPAREMLARFSPTAVAGDVRADVLAMHSRDDPAVPYAELLRLRSAFPGARTYSVASFRHVDPGRDAGLFAQLRDLRTVWRFADDVLR
jgi:alpha-beta hydrolase superfamily lysophospholipase